MAQYDTIPTGATLDVRPFKAHVEEEKLQHFKQLLELSPIGPAVFENTSAGRRYGTTRDWLETAKKVWLEDFDWRKYEDRMNSYPNFKAPVKDAAGNTIDMQFFALFSEKADAIPIAFLHGWPVSSCCFLDVLDILRKKYSPQELPYHVVVPSLPGYAYTSGPPVDSDYRIDIAAGALDDLMVGLGFGSGYLVQGGDLGSFMSRLLATNYDACKGMHVNMMAPSDLEGVPMDDKTKKLLAKISDYLDTETGFIFMQGTKAATVGLALSASPLALLSWLGDKFLAFTDEDLPLQTILESVTLYWMTDTIPRCFYHNRGMGNPDENPKIARSSVIMKGSPIKVPFVEKPSGYSLFPKEVVPAPESWAMKSCNLVSFNEHEHGGHFAALEQPNELLADVEEYVRVAWKQNK